MRSTWRKSGPMAAVLLAVSFLLLIASSSAASAQETLEVGEGKDYATIQEAINKAPDGSTILVYPGTYEEAILIKKKSLTIKSVEGAENTIIDYEKSYIVGINHSNVIFDGFTISGKGAIRVRGYGGTPTENVSILNNMIIGIRGIELAGAMDGVTGMTIVGNTIINCDYGIRIKVKDSVGNIAGIAENVNIENNNIVNSGVQNDGAATVDATLNWWGVTTRSGIEPMVSGDVIFDPCLDAAYPEGVSMSVGEGGPEPIDEEPIDLGAAAMLAIICTGVFTAVVVWKVKEGKT